MLTHLMQSIGHFVWRADHRQRPATWLIALLTFVVPTLLAQVAALAQPPAPVVVATVQKRQLAGGQPLVGSIVPLKRSEVGSAVDGRVVDFPINEGDRVTKGQALCRLLTDTITLQITSAAAELAFREAELLELKNGSRPEEIKQAKARLEAARAQNEYATSKYKRATQLADAGQLPREQLEESFSASIASTQQFIEATEALELAEQGPRAERIAQAAARVEIQAANVQQLKDQLKKHTMIAPFDGYVVAERTEVGEWVERGQVVAEIVAVDEVDVLIGVPEQSIDQLRLGGEVRVEVPALNKELFVGAIAAINPQAEVKSRTFPVKVRVANRFREDGPVLKAGMLARATLPTGDRQETLLVPKDAVVLGGQTPIVYLAMPNPSGDGLTATLKPVTMGVAEGGWVAVSGDLKPGERVVVQGNERLRPGQAISILKSLSADEENQ